MHRPQIRFLQQKSEATRTVKDYVAHLKTNGMQLRAFRYDRGREFINKELQDWLTSQGIELQMIAPYSPSQNGATEHLNRMLIELARAMMIAQDVPPYLWEYAVQHAMYICERAPAAALAGKTPYETWYGAKPDVTHLREFGGPVYILLQG